MTEGLNGMVRCHLSRLMGEHKLKVIDVARETGLHRNTITLLYKETANRIELETIDKLCVLFNCQVSDLLEWVEDKTEENNKAKG
jgi:putative transcriptional regulator